MFDWEDERELSDDERREQDLVAELRAERQDLDDRLGIAHLGPRQRAEERGFRDAFGLIVAAEPPGGTSGHEAEHAGPERPPAGTSGWHVEQDRKEQDDDTSDHKTRGSATAGKTD